MNDSRIEQALIEGYGLSPEIAGEVVFHLNDILPDLRRLLDTLENADERTNDEVVDGILDVMVHLPAHVLAAAHLMGHTPGDIFEYGIEVQPRAPGSSPSS